MLRKWSRLRRVDIIVGAFAFLSSAKRPKRPLSSLIYFNVGLLIYLFIYFKVGYATSMDILSVVINGNLFLNFIFIPEELT